MEIRSATREDIDAVRAVAESSWETDYPDTLSRETIRAGIEQWYDEKVIQLELASPRSVLLVAEAEGRIVGFGHGHRAGPVGTIMRLYVDPDHRGQGFGGELFDALVDELQAADVERIQAMALDGNDPGKEFYTSRGMTQIGVEETAIGGQQHEEAIFELELVGEDG